MSLRPGFFEVPVMEVLLDAWGQSRRIPTCAEAIPPSRIHDWNGNAMRSCVLNSPEAAARIVAIVLMVDGHVCRSEFDVLDQLDGSHELRLTAGDMPRIVQSLCEDLLAGAYGGSSLMASLDADTLASVKAEVDDPALQRTVLRLAVAAALADGHLAEGEALGLAAARRHWPLCGESDSASPVAAHPQAA